MEFLILLKINNIYIIQFLFLLNFLLVFLISYPIGHLINDSKYSKNLLFCSIISISFASIPIAIIMNFAASVGKYLIISFFLLNLVIGFVNKII